MTIKINSVFKTLVYFIRNNYLLSFLLLLSLLLAIILKQQITNFPNLVDWNTIISLIGLLLITMGIKESGFFSLLACRISQRINNIRFLALFLVSASFLISMFLTNDIALFVIVPLTLSLENISKNNLTKTIIFEAIAVNVGSSLTAIGNPQNIILWHQWNITFLMFIREMFPLVFVLILFLLIFVLLTFPSDKIERSNVKYKPVNRKLFFLSSILLILFVISIEISLENYFLIVVVVSFLYTYRNVIIKSDWGLILLFIFIFIDIHLLTELKVVQQLLLALDLKNIRTLFLSSAFLSQIISNVPSTILISHYSSDFKIISYGVNIGGNGLFIASFANLIALRLIKDKSKYLKFHLYSIPYFIITLIFVYLLLI